MIITFPSKEIKNEYNYLKSSKKEVNINNTSKKLDSYVYDKTHKFNNAKTFGLLTAMDLLYAGMWFKSKNKNFLTNSLFMLLLANGIILNCIFDEEKNKKYTLNNKDEKLRLYYRNGINAVV